MLLQQPSLYSIDYILYTSIVLFIFTQAMRTQFVTLSMEYDARGSSYGKSRIMEEEEPVVHYAGADSLLREEDYERYPDLQMFPSMAG